MDLLAGRNVSGLNALICHVPTIFTHIARQPRHTFTSQTEQERERADMSASSEAGVGVDMGVSVRMCPCALGREVAWPLRDRFASGSCELSFITHFHRAFLSLLHCQDHLSLRATPEPCYPAEERRGHATVQKEW
ncbi:hypothetical protein AOLI_G00021520 [Acnodon oligacanthus]